MARKKEKKIPNLGPSGTKKEVRHATGIPDSYDKCLPSWKFHLIDKEGQWGWNKLSPDEIWNILSNRLNEKEHINWSTLKQSGSHNVSIEDLTKEAKKRLEEIGQSDLDELFSLRLSGKERVWGIRDRSALKILWWDPEHEVCPSQKKHT